MKGATNSTNMQVDNLPVPLTNNKAKGQEAKIQYKPAMQLLSCLMESPSMHQNSP